MKNKLRLISVCAVSAVMFLSACGASDKSAETADAAPKAEEKAEESKEEIEEDAAETAEEVSEAVVNPDLHYENEYFSVDLPESWDGLWMTQEYNLEAEEYEGERIGASHNTVFYCKDCYEKYEGTGFITSIELTEDPPISIEYIGGDCVGIMTRDDTGEKLYVRLGYPTDVQFDEETQDVYTSMYENRKELKDTFAPAEGWTLERMSYEQVMAGIERTFDGVAMSVSGNKAYFYNEFESSTVCMNLKGGQGSGIVVGHAYTVTYTGTFVTGNPEDASLVKLRNIDGRYDYNVDAAILASKVILATDKKDMAELAELCQFPVEVDDRVINSAQEFSAMKFEDVFSDELERFVKVARLTELPSNSNEADLSILPEYSHIHLQNSGSGWKITGFYNVPMDY